MPSIISVLVVCVVEQMKVHLVVDIASHRQWSSLCGRLHMRSLLHMFSERVEHTENQGKYLQVPSTPLPSYSMPKVGFTCKCLRNDTKLCYNWTKYLIICDFSTSPIKVHIWSIIFQSQ